MSIAGAIGITGFDEYDCVSTGIELADKQWKTVD